MCTSILRIFCLAAPLQQQTTPFVQVCSRFLTSGGKTASSRMQCCKKLWRGLWSQKRERRKRGQKWDKASAPGETKFLLSRGHCCSSVPDPAGLCTLWAPKGSSQLGSLGSDMGRGVSSFTIPQFVSLHNCLVCLAPG